MVKLWIAGPRDLYPSPEFLDHVIKNMFKKEDLESIIVGDASGVDAIAYTYAISNNIPVEVYKAEWDKYGKAAGPLRNRQCQMQATAGIIIKRKGHETRGTTNATILMKKKDILKACIEME